MYNGDNKDIVDILVMKTSDVDAKDSTGLTALFYGLF